MSRKSRIHACQQGKNFHLWGCLGLALLMIPVLLFFTLTTVFALQEDPLHTDITREETIEEEVTLLSARRGLFRHTTQLEFTDHAPLTIRFGRQNIWDAKNWPAGTRLTLLLHPLEKDYVVSLTKDGEELIRFEDFQDFVVETRVTRVAFLTLCYAICAAGSTAILVWFIRRRKHIPKIR